MSTSTTICGVCLDECGEKNIAITECGHMTHLKCFARVLVTSDNCIYCRKKLNLMEETTTKDDEYHQFGVWIDDRQPFTLRKMAETLLIITLSAIYGYLFIMCCKILAEDE